jgi:hypothetical protein
MNKLSILDTQQFPYHHLFLREITIRAGCISSEKGRFEAIVEIGMSPVKNFFSRMFL